MFQKTITLLVVSSLFRSVLGGPPPKQYNFQFLRGGFETIVDCESPASISCVEGIMSGDKNFNGIATVVFDEIVPIDLLGSFNYAGTYEFALMVGIRLPNYLLEQPLVPARSFPPASPTMSKAKSLSAEGQVFSITANVNLPRLVPSILVGSLSMKS